METGETNGDHRDWRDHCRAQRLSETDWVKGIAPADLNCDYAYYTHVLLILSAKSVRW